MTLQPITPNLVGHLVKKIYLVALVIDRDGITDVDTGETALGTDR